jgi:steroid delta-isomerase-like uncharacterized protein
MENTNFESALTPVQQFYETVVNGRQPDLFAGMVDDNFCSHIFPTPGANEFEFSEALRSLTDAFPDFSMVMEDCCYSSDRVFTRGYWTGTHRGYFQGMPATGRRLKVPFLDCWKLKNGKLAENWLLMDYLEILLRLEPAGLFSPERNLDNN